MSIENDFVDYESFGATRDGVSDDLPAICDAHRYANEHGLSVRTKPDATYHLGSQALTAMIATDTDWTTSRFTIDDTQVEDHRRPLFEVCSLQAAEILQIDRLERDQRRVDQRPKRDCHVLVEDENRKLFIRRGPNQNSGVPQQDCFILRRDGSIEGNIDWNYNDITRLEARPIDEPGLVLRGGVFTTFANRMKLEAGYNYWSRNIAITRSNIEVDGLAHYVAGETADGQPYGGFLSVQSCADITLRNCFFTGHKIYTTIGSAGKPITMGTYDVSASRVVNFRMIDCNMNHICDRTRWGVIGTNFCKNILIENCTLSRMDTHMGVSGEYTIRRCRLGHMGLNAIGRGTLTVEDSTLYGNALVRFRSDYGSTWEGDLVIRNCRWVPGCGETILPSMIGVSNDGMHNFGYPCSMPREVVVDGLVVDDANHPEDYQGMYLFTDPDAISGIAEDANPTGVPPFPYVPCQKISVSGLVTKSGMRPRVSPNERLEQSIIMIEKEQS